jgi:hypothetical protein
MVYNDTKNQGVKLNGIPKKIYNFSPEEKIETVLVILINDLGKEVLINFKQINNLTFTHYCLL